MVRESAQDGATGEAQGVTGMADSIVHPKNPVTRTVAEVTVVFSEVHISFPAFRDDFRLLVRSLGYRWTGNHWCRAMTIFTGTPDDRAAETAHRLLDAGFPVYVQDPVIRDRTLSGTYTPEQKRWIARELVGLYTDWFALRWPREDNLYRDARCIPGSRYERYTVYAPRDRFAEVLDFANQYKFRLSSGAMQLVEMARRERRDALLTFGTSPRTTGVDRYTRGVPQKLPVPEVTVADALRDDD